MSDIAVQRESEAPKSQLTHALAHLFAVAGGMWLQVYLCGRIFGGQAGWLDYAALVVTEAVLIFLYFCLGLLLHEGAHGHICRNKRLNWFISVLSATPIQIVPSLFRELHWLHHKNPNTPHDYELIPETRLDLTGRRRYNAMLRLMILGGLERGRVQERLIVDKAIPLKESVRQKSKWEFVYLKVVMLGGSAAWIYYLGFWSWLIGYTIPALAGTWMLVWLQFIEHFGLEPGRKPEGSRDVLPRNAWQRFVYWMMYNINYHGLHHANAYIPGYKLPEAHEDWSRKLTESNTPPPSTHYSYIAALKHTVPYLMDELRRTKRGEGEPIHDLEPNEEESRQVETAL